MGPSVQTPFADFGFQGVPHSFDPSSRCVELDVGLYSSRLDAGQLEHVGESLHEADEEVVEMLAQVALESENEAWRE